MFAGRHRRCAAALLTVSSCKNPMYTMIYLVFRKDDSIPWGSQKHLPVSRVRFQKRTIRTSNTIMKVSLSTLHFEIAFCIFRYGVWQIRTRIVGKH